MMRPLVFGAVLAFPAIVPAQARPDSTIVTLPQVSVTATRSTLSTRAMPVTVTVFDRAALRDAGITQVADVLRLVPGATVLATGSFGSQAALFLRGGQSDYVQVLVDGVPVNSPGGAYDFGQLTLDNVERVEVVRGPASVLYGSDAVSGVIQLFTRKGTGPARMNGLIGGGTYGTRAYELGVAGGSPRAGGSLAGARHSTSGILPFNSGFHNDVLSGAAHVRGDHADAMASVRLTDYTFHYPTNSAGALTDSNAYTSERRVIASGEVGWKPAPVFELRARLANDQSNPRTRDLPDYVGDPNLYTADATVTRHIVEARAIATIRRSHVLTLSAERARDHEESTSHSESAYGPFDGGLTATRTNDGLAAQLLGNVGGRTTYTVGARRDRNSEFGTFTTWRAAAAMRVTATASVRASFGTAFKAPTFYENFATGFAVGNRALAPERSRTWEAGVQYASTDTKLTLGGTVFAQRFRDLVQYIAVVPANAPNYANLAGAAADGVELELGWRLAPGFVARGSYTYLHSRVTDAGVDSGPSAAFVTGERLLRRPTHLATLGLRESIAEQGSFDISATYTGSRDDRDFSVFPAIPVVMKGFVRLDVATVRPLDDFGPLHQPSLVVRVENALNVSYQQTLGFRAPGRTYFFGLRIGD